MNIFKRPMFFAAVACSAVAVISLYNFNLAFLLAAVITLLLGFVVFKGGIKYIAVLAAFLLFALCLFLEYQKIDRINAVDGEKVSGKFVIVSEPQEYEKFNTLTLKATDCENLPKGTKYLVFDYSKTQLQSGNTVYAKIKISVIEPDDEYRLYDYGNAVYAKASASSLEKLDEVSYFYKFAGNIHNYLKKTVSSIADGDVSGLLIALTTGDKSQLSDKFLNNVKTTGISHIIVVSGMHLSIIMSGIFYVLDRLFYNKYIRSLLSVFTVLLISGVCGFTMSVTRAGIMFIIAGLAPVFDRENDSLNSLFTAVALVLMSSPFAIANVSFQLSVMSTLAIIWIVPFYSKLFIEKFKVSSRITKAILEIIFCSLFATLFTLPVTIKTFGYVSIVSPLTNLLITYPVMTALVFNVAALILSVIPVLNIFGNIAFFVAKICSAYIVFVVNKIAEIPITIAILPDSAFVFSILLIAVFVGFMYVYDFRRKKKRSDF